MRLLIAGFWREADKFQLMENNGLRLLLTEQIAHLLDMITLAVLISVDLGALVIAEVLG